MALLDLWNAANNENFKGRCYAALWKLANSITLEDPATPNHPQRQAWAVSVLRSRERISAHELVIVVLRAPGIGGLADPTTASDTAIENQINSSVDLLMSLG